MCTPLPISSSYISDENILASDHFLSVEERFQVYIVKAAERKHLLNIYEEEKKEEDQDNDENLKSENTDLVGKECDTDNPIIDGCDIPGWRYRRLASYSSTSDVCALFNVGAGNAATMLRRSSQWPVLRSLYYSSTLLQSRWSILKNRLLRDVNSESLDAAPRIEYDTDCILNFWRFEEENVPVTILNAATEWMSMPTPVCQSMKSNENIWTFENLLHRFGSIMWRFSDQHG